MRVLLPEEMQAVDAYAITKLGIPGAVLMENAGAGVTEGVMDIVSTSVCQCGCSLWAETMAVTGL